MIVRVALVSAVLSTSSLAHAEQRAFLNTYESTTMVKGDVQIDAPTIQAFGLGDETFRAFQLELDVAYGLTDNLDIAAYQVYAESRDADPMTTDVPLHFEESRVRMRYRFAAPGELPVDLLAMLEAAKSFPTETIRFSPRVVVAKTIDAITVAANVYGNALFRPDSYLDLGWAAGATYEIVPELKLGLEAFGEYRLRDGEATTWIGPCGLWAPSGKAWGNACIGFGLGENSIDLRTHFSVSVKL
jgi:hypothetical protein